MESKKLTKKEIDAIVNVQSKTQEIQSTFGAIALRQLELDNARQAQTEAFTELRAEETKLAASLEKKYGSGNIDLENGVFMPHTSASVVG